MNDGRDDLDRRLRDHFAATSEPLPRDVVAAARARLEPRPGPRLGSLVAAASLVAVTFLVAVVAVGTPSTDPLAPSAPVTAAPTARATATASASPGEPAYGPGQTLRATRAIPMTTDWTIGIGQVLYVIAVDGDRYEIQHWGDLETGLKPDTVIGTVETETVDARTEAYEPTCPSGFEGIEPVAALHPFERLVCFGSRSITIAPVRREEYQVLAGNPPWLAGPAGVDFFTGLPFAVADGLDVPAGTWLRVTGHFDDPACEGDLRCRERFLVTAFEPAPPPPSELRGEWRVMAPAPIAGRLAASGVWTGQEFLVWGGTVAPGDTEGAAYDPTADSWRTMAASPLESRVAHAAVWTGREMIIWGGLGNLDATEPERTAAAYDPLTDTWRRIADAPLAGFHAVWAGSEMIALGTQRGVAAYDPETDSWRTLSDPPGDASYLRQLVWTGTEVLLFDAPDGSDTAVRGFRLDEDGTTWRPLAASNWSAPAAGPIIWAGSEAISLGQYPESSEGGLTNSVAYDPTADRWRAVSACEVSDHTVWTGTHILGDQGAYDVAAEVCLTLPTPPERPVGGTTGREGSAFAWTGSEYLIWSGGNGSDYAAVDGDGVVFRPERP